MIAGDDKVLEFTLDVCVTDGEVIPTFRPIMDGCTVPKVVAA